jgi:hypothetical protein
MIDDLARRIGPGMFAVGLIVLAWESAVGRPASSDPHGTVCDVEAENRGSAARRDSHR